MQRTCVSRNHEFRAAEEGHERAERERNFKRWHIPRGAYKFAREAVLAWAETHDPAPAVAFCELTMQFPVAFRRPAFRKPAAAGIQHVEIRYAAVVQFTRHKVIVFRTNCERKSWLAEPCTDALNQRSIVIDLVRSKRIHTVGIQHRDEALARIAALKTDSARRARSQGKQR